MKFDFSKSDNADLQNKFQYLYTRLDKILEFERYQLELLQRIIKHYMTDSHLQTQVDDFYPDEETSEHIPEKA